VLAESRKNKPNDKQRENHTSGHLHGCASDSVVGICHKDNRLPEFVSARGHAGA
jgi:hypothetical protein